MRGSLGALLGAQRRFMRLLGVRPDATLGLSSPELLDAVTGMVCEAGEVLADLRTRNRPWKTPASEDHVIEETVDVFFYLLETWEILGLDEADVELAYAKKLARNLHRIEEHSQDPHQVKGAQDWLQILRVYKKGDDPNA